MWIMSKKELHIIGAGLAGSEAAWQAANMGVNVVIHEMRPDLSTAAHQTDKCAELVCSNSFRSDDYKHNAVGLLHEEMRKLDSIIMRGADATAIPAGGALAVDVEHFSDAIGDALEAHKAIKIERGEVSSLTDQGWDHVIVATGPLTSDALSAEIQRLTGENALSFFDAIAPIVYMDSINMDTAWFQSRYNKAGPAGTGEDYLNCAMDKEQYETFIHELIHAKYGDFKEWEKDTPYFEGCMPIEVMAARGIETLRFGPMKPVGLVNPHKDEPPYAVVQLRQDNALGTLYNLVGFQTKMKYGEQERVFRMIPGLENAEFARLGGMHRNIFINSPKLLDPHLRLKAYPHIRFAGQLTGCEGYVESASIGLLAGRFAAAEILGKKDYPLPPETTALGALLGHVTGGANAETFQPMNINFGLFPVPSDDYMRPVQPNGRRKKLKGKDRKRVYTDIACKTLNNWLEGVNDYMPGDIKTVPQKELVVLLHGILRRNLDMSMINSRFKKRGYATLNILYPSREQPIEALSDFVHQKIISCPDYSPQSKLNFVTHSMGGLITRYYIAQQKPENLGKVVMLSPPNTGSEFADWLSETEVLAPLFKAFFGPAATQLRTDYTHIDTQINYPLGIIAGSLSINPLAPWVLEGEHDGIVPVERTKIEGMSDHIVIPTTHSFMMFNNEVIDQALYFFEHGRFDHPQEPSNSL